MALSKRAEKALEVLRAGGYFRKALEMSYRGGEKFVTRLYSAGGSRVPGFGFKSFIELKPLLAYRPCPKSSVWPEEFVLPSVDKAA